jgi:probable phosphoglycerate mutase
MNYLLSSPTLPTSPNTSTSSTKVILVRHARTTYNEQGRYQGSSDESVLTEKGHQDAYATGLALQQFTFDAIYTSPLTRVQQTTEAIITALKQTTNHLPPIAIESKLTEINMSVWQGLFYQEVKEKFSEAYNCWQETPHLFSFNDNFFPVLELFQQAQQFWQSILDKHPGQTILIVAHGGTNRALISKAIGLHPKHYHSLQQSNCGISLLEFASNSDYGRLKSLNVTDHLAEYLPKLKAGKTGWRWLLLPNHIENKLLRSSCLTELIVRDFIDLVLTDSSLQSEFLAINFIKNNTQIIHLPIVKKYFLETWQKTIFTRQKLNYFSNNANLITGLIIVQKSFIDRILQKTLGKNITLEHKNCLSVIHYPSANQQSILQGILPLSQLPVIN